ncbi:MAG: hypothetical protein LAP38_11435 [Acidobacteriia bacterium]|nr:hypothetical protein [Terriglobia bacterium]
MRLPSLCVVLFLSLEAGGFAQFSGPLTISNAPPGGTVGTSYTFQFRATGGSGNYNWQWFPADAPGGSLPPGLSLGPLGLISGTPSQPGNFLVQVNVVDNTNSNLQAVQNFSIGIAACLPKFVTTSPLTDGEINVPYRQVFTASGCSAPYTFTAEAASPFNPSGLPSGLALSASGVLSGTPDTVGTNAFDVTVTEGQGGSTTSAFSLTINPPPDISTPSPLPNGVEGVAYSFTFVVTGGVPPYSFGVSNLPAGFALSKAGVLNVAAPKAGTFSLDVSVTDSLRVSSQPKTFKVTFVSSAPLLQVSPSSLDFSATAGGDSPPSQALSLVPAAGANSPNFRALVDGGQASVPVPFSITVQPASGTAPAQLVVSADQGNMTAGKSTARIRIIDTNSQETDIPVSLTVVSSPVQLQAVPVMLRFVAQSPGTFQQDLVFTNGGSGSAGSNGFQQNSAGATPAAASLGFSVTVLGGSYWISVTPSSGQTAKNSPVYIAVRVNTQGLQPGNHSDTLRISSSGDHVDVPISVFVSSPGPVLGTSVTGLRFRAQQGGGYSNAQTVKILNLGDPSTTVHWTASIARGEDFLSLDATSGTATGSTPGSLTLTLKSGATQSSPGGHYSLVKISDANAQNSPVYIVAVLDLAPSGSPALPDLSPAGLFFTAVAGGVQTSAQLVIVNTSSPTAAAFQVAASTDDGAKWLIVSPASGQASGQTPGSFSAVVDPSKMTTGIHTAQASVSMSGVVRTVNVTAVVLSGGSTVVSGTASRAAAEAIPRAAGCAPSKLALTETGLVNNFAVPAKWPATLIVQLNDDCGAAVAGGSVVASFSNGDAPLTLRGDGQGATYSATWQPTAATSEMVVTLNATAATLQPASTTLIGGVSQNQNLVPSLAPSGTLNNLNPVVGQPVAPGTIVQVFGSSLAISSVEPGVIPVPTQFNGTFALVGPYQVPLYFLSDGQLNVQIPDELVATQQYPILVSVNNALSLPDTLDLAPVTPGVLSNLDGPEPPSVQNGAHLKGQHNADFSLVTSANPAKPGEFVIMYVVGMGATDPSVPSGKPAPGVEPLARVTVQPTVTVDNQQAHIAFAGLTPGLVGLYQVTFQVPASARSGDLDVVLTQNGRSANTVKLPVSQ